MKQLLFTITLSLMSTICLTAQEVIPASGGEASGTGGSASYTVGQVFYETHLGVDGSVSEGVQQPYEISIISEIESVIAIDLTVSAYPNPTTDFLILNVEESDFSDLSFQLFDIQGRVLQSQIIEANQTNISMRNLLPANYFVKILQNDTEVKVFKIIKK
jgi:hypothetical protein